MKIAFIDNADGHYEYESVSGEIPEWAKNLTSCAIRPPIEKSLAECKIAQTAKINQSADLSFSVITSPYPKQEVDTWPNQYAEAWALQSDPNAYTPTLSVIAFEYGIAVPVLATSVLQKAAAYTVASGQIIGKRKKLVDQINSATTNTQVEAIVW